MIAAYDIVLGLLQVDEEHDLIIITSSGVLIRSSVKDISVISRNTQGVKLISVGDDAKVVGITHLAEKNGDENGDGEDETDGEETASADAENGEAGGITAGGDSETED